MFGAQPFVDPDEDELDDDDDDYFDDDYQIVLSDSD